MFQSTHPRGVRLLGGEVLHQDHDVSIHAPAWGATIGVNDQWNKLICFNPRTRVGCDRPNERPQIKRRQFQSTHPRGVRREAAVGDVDGPLVSIHAPAWGATSYRQRPTTPLASFQSTHPRGVRRDVLGEVAGQHGFQSTHPRGVRHHRLLHRVRHAVFQSTHPRGVRPPSPACSCSVPVCFNPRTRVGCDFFRIQIFIRVM